jgi:putative iron-only hydrogenase system regulator
LPLTDDLKTNSVVLMARCSEPEVRRSPAAKSARAQLCFLQLLRWNGGGVFSFLQKGEEIMETRVAVVAIIVREAESVAALNDLLHQYGAYIVGRMGVPYRERGVNIISVAMDAPAGVISALSGKIGRLKGVTAKTVYAPEEALN